MLDDYFYNKWLILFYSNRLYRYNDNFQKETKM